MIYRRRSLWQNVFILIFPQASHQICSRQCGGAWTQARSAPSLLQSIVCLTDSWHQMTIQFCFEKGRKENLGITPGLTCFDPPRCLMLKYKTKLNNYNWCFLWHNILEMVIIAWLFVFIWWFFVSIGRFLVSVTWFLVSVGRLLVPIRGLLVGVGVVVMVTLGGLLQTLHNLSW